MGMRCCNLLLGLLWLIVSEAALAKEYDGCSLSATEATGSNGLPLVSSLGNKNFDAHVIQMVRDMHAILDVKGDVSIDFDFYDDSNGPNAYALTKGHDGADYGIILGVNLARRFSLPTNESDLDTIGVQVVMMHEIAHVGQYMIGVYGEPKNKELMADVMSGWWVGTVTAHSNDASLVRRKIVSSLKIVYSLGDLKFNSPLHHGTPDERVSAFNYGMHLAKNEKSLSFWGVMFFARLRYGLGCRKC